MVYTILIIVINNNTIIKFLQILNLNINLQADNTPIAIVKVANHQEAQLAISHLHHYKLGYKKLSIAYAQSGHLLDPMHLREMVIALLQVRKYAVYNLTIYFDMMTA